LQTRSQQVTREAGTQMAAVGLYYEEENHEEKEIVPKKYFTADELAKLKHNKVEMRLGHFE
jgi:hypothetical protein